MKDPSTNTISYTRHIDFGAFAVRRSIRRTTAQASAETSPRFYARFCETIRGQSGVKIIRHVIIEYTLSARSMLHYYLSDRHHVSYAANHVLTTLINLTLDHWQPPDMLLYRILEVISDISFLYLGDTGENSSNIMHTILQSAADTLSAQVLRQLTTTILHRILVASGNCTRRLLP